MPTEVPAQNSEPTSTANPGNQAPDLTQSFLSALQPPTPNPTSTTDPTTSATSATTSTSGTQAGAQVGAPTEGEPPTPAPGEGEEPEVPVDELPEDEASFEASGPVDPTSTRGKQLWADHKVMVTLSKPLEDGGIGHQPTVEDIRTYFQSHQITNRIYGDLMEGNPEFLSGMSAPNPEGMAKILATLPEFLTVGPGGRTDLRAPDGRPMSEVFQPVREAIVQNVTQGQVDRFLEAARSARSPEERTEYFAVAKALAKNFLGKDLSDKDMDLPQVDPHEAEKARLRRQVEENERYRKQVIEANFAAYQSSVMADADQLLTSAAETAMGNFKDMPGFSKAARSLAATALDAVEKNPAAVQELKVMWRRVANAMNNPNVDQQWLDLQKRAISNAILKYAKPQLTYQRDAVAKEFGMRVARPATKRPEPVRGPAAAGATPPVATAQPLEKRPGESDSDFMSRAFMARLIQ